MLYLVFLGVAGTYACSNAHKNTHTEIQRERESKTERRFPLFMFK